MWPQASGIQVFGSSFFRFFAGKQKYSSYCANFASREIKEEKHKVLYPRDCSKRFQNRSSLAKDGWHQHGPDMARHRQNGPKQLQFNIRVNHNNFIVYRQSSNSAAAFKKASRAQPASSQTTASPTTATSSSKQQV
jgi:hypothetical protein